MYSTYTAQKWRRARSAISAAVRVDGDAEVSFLNEPALNHRQPSTLIHSKKILKHMIGSVKFQTFSRLISSTCRIYLT